MHPPLKVLIAGLGYLGEALAEGLLKEGYQVWGLRRTAAATSHSQLHIIAADLTDQSSLAQAQLPAVDVVFYMPAAKHRDPQRYRQVYQQGLRNLLAALPQKPKHLFYVSSTSVYGQNQGEWISEESPAKPDALTAQVIAAVEEEFIASDLPFTSLRFAGIYGPGRESFCQRVATGQECLDADEQRYTNRIHRDDGVAACLHLLQIDKKADIYNIVDCDPASRNEVIRWMCQQLGRELPAVKDIAPHELRANKRVSNARLLATGFQFQYPSFREGYRELLNKP
ncbi:MAG: SDR family oxidoreductase [Oligoflexus sp.]